MSSHTERPRDALAALKIDRSRESHGGNRGNGRSGLRLTGILVTVAIVAIVSWITWRSGLLDRVLTFARVPALLHPTPEVRVAKLFVETGRAADAVVVATGYLESRRQAKIGARSPGRIEIIHVEEGSRVERDQIVASLEHADLDAALAAARASLNIARSQWAEHQITVTNLQREHTRAERLWRSKSLTDAEYDKSKFDYESAVAKTESLTASISLAEARVQEAEQLRENVFVRAPFHGTVISKDAEVGESILPGGMGEASGRGSVVTIADLDHLEVDSDVKEDFISRVREGQLAQISVDAVPDRTYAGRVRKIIPMGDRARATIKVKVEVLDADGRLFPDMSATVRFLADTTEATQAEGARRRIHAPLSAVQPDPQQDSTHRIWIVDNEDRACQLRVTTGSRRDQQVEIVSGLQGDERVIVEPSSFLRYGQSVKPVAE